MASINDTSHYSQQALELANDAAEMAGKNKVIDAATQGTQKQ